MGNEMAPDIAEVAARRVGWRGYFFPPPAESGSRSRSSARASPAEDGSRATGTSGARGTTAAPLLILSPTRGRAPPAEAGSRPTSAGRAGTAEAEEAVVGEEADEDERRWRQERRRLRGAG